MDDSTQQVTFGGSGDTREVTLTDDNATVACETGGQATARGTGTVDGNEIEAVLTLRCADGTPPLTATVTFTYDPDSDTLTDDTTCDGDDCIVYHRPGQ